MKFDSLVNKATQQPNGPFQGEDSTNRQLHT